MINLEDLKKQFEKSNELRKKHLIELKNSYEFEINETPKLRNKLFKKIMQKIK